MDLGGLVLTARRTFAWLVAAALALVACGGVDVGRPSQQATGEHDLTDPSTLARLGVPEPDIDWERPIDRLVYAGVGTAPSDAEVELVAQVIDDLPTALLARLDVRRVIRSTAETTVRSDHPSAVAFAVGPDIYLLDTAFTLSDGGSTRYDLSRAVAHELVHVAQFQTMDPDYINATLNGEVDRLNPVDGSLLVRDFAERTGWTDVADNPLDPTWVLNVGLTAASSYGATGPGEDMAEAVALVVLGLADLVPDAHVSWVEEWLESPADALALGQPWAPAGSMEVLSTDPLYDVERVRAAQGSLTHAEPLYFQLPNAGPAGAALASEVESRLRTRVMAGTLEQLDDTVVPRWGGRFTGTGGRFWWVELWDFPNAAAGTIGPDGPILVYVAIW